ncbi:hypothetical protein DFO67_108203 [Modicisalibacter xianhensis]|uniref:Uncharacterized protein n=1 Tax=Modicisalibacter xianhensis TaxID=442341 RepID=A0A4R8FRG1_9GAMM|nr:hypothetical protein DFO67_108203 [Halomonas xianhensis]
MKVLNRVFTMLAAIVLSALVPLSAGAEPSQTLSESSYGEESSMDRAGKTRTGTASSQEDAAR